MIKDKTVTEFLDNEYSGSALYMNYRATPSYIDGLKNGARKAVYTLKKRGKTGELKVSNFAGAIIEESNYIHGNTSMEGTLVTLAQNYRGANNLPILEGIGSFGTTFINEASASRYIFVKAPPYFELLFRNTDEPALVEQTFEGDTVEPRYYIPTLPLVLINGCTGIGVGFACKILDRNPKNIIKAIRNKLDGKRLTKNLFVPDWNGFTGTVVSLGNNKWEIRGSATQNGKKITITELPVGYELQQYLSILKKLRDKNIITKFDDFSEDDRYSFIVTLSDEENKKSFEEIFNDLKLSVTITESLTCVDENNAIVEFTSAEELFDRYYKFKMESLQIRLDNEIERLEKEAAELKEIQDFILAVIDDRINIKSKRSELEDKMKSLGFTITQKLISMPLYSLTVEKCDEARKKYMEKCDEIDRMKKETPKTLWLKDLGLIEKYV